MKPQAVIVVWYVSGYRRIYWADPQAVLSEAAKRIRSPKVRAASLKAPNSPTWMWEVSN